MRETKFKVWDKVYKCWVDNAKLWLMGGVSIEGLWSTENVILCQYTGLKDKNGIEIYEGHILRWMGSVYPITVESFHGYRFMWGRDTLFKSLSEGEVIGNIYDNPELIG